MLQINKNINKIYLGIKCINNINLLQNKKVISIIKLQIIQGIKVNKINHIVTNYNIYHKQ